MQTCSSHACIDDLEGRTFRNMGVPTQSGSMDWRTLPFDAKLYALTIIAIGGFLIVKFFPINYPQPLLFTTLLMFACITSAWKVHLQLSPNSDSTLSVSYAADLMALVLLGSAPAMIIAAMGAWTQCTFKVKQPYPAYRTVFSMAAVAITIQATGWTYLWLGGTVEPRDIASLPRPLVGAIAMYFLVNTTIVAGAIALSSGRLIWLVWRDNFLWSAPSFMVAGGAGALAAVAVVHGGYWLAILALAPIYLTYRTYRVFLGRIEDARDHLATVRQLHSEAVEALSLATRAERALADEKERLSVTLRSIADGVITTDLDGNVVLMNKAAERLTGWSERESIGRPLATILQNFDRRTRTPSESPLDELSRNVDTLSLTRSTVLVARDLAERPIEEIIAPIRDAAGRTIGMITAFRDITDALKAQEERAQEDKLASLGLLAAGIAHDFNNILMAVMGNVSLARVTVPPGGAAAALADAEQACVHARHLTWQLLTFSRGGIPAKKTIALSRVLKDSVNLVQRTSNVTSTLDISSDLWMVHADAAQLMQVFTNVLVNAQQSMPHGGVIAIRADNIVERTSRVEFALPVAAGSYVRITIKDRGIGIPDENLPSIFDPYFSTKEQGRGLGLATAHSIIKNHGGYVSVESKPGFGTTVHMNFPAVKTCEAEEILDLVDLARAQEGRILVMDDEASIRTLTSNMLTFLGYNAEVVTDGTQAVEYYKHALAKGQPFDAVILDLIIPGGMGAKETVERLNQLNPNVKAILVSGYAQDPAITEFRQHGFTAAITKPFSLEELSRTLRSIHNDPPPGLRSTTTVH